MFNVLESRCKYSNMHKSEGATAYSRGFAGLISPWAGPLSAWAHFTTTGTTLALCLRQKHTRKQRRNLQPMRVKDLSTVLTMILLVCACREVVRLLQDTEITAPVVNGYLRLVNN